MLTLGVDEVGRGCWAGPLVAGAVLLRRPVNGLTDSKLLSAQARRQLAEVISKEAIATALGWVSVSEVDELGLTAAVKKAMERAVAAITVGYDEIIIDGNYNFLPERANARPLIKADLSVMSVSAASVLAKVARDGYMAAQAALYPDYGFESHVGYGTAQHKAAIIKYGITPLHRRSFKPIKAYIRTD